MKNGKLVWIDEALTPDSSRFWPADQYQPGSNPPSFDKQFVRDWLEAQRLEQASAGAGTARRNRDKDQRKIPRGDDAPAGVNKGVIREARERGEGFIWLFHRYLLVLAGAVGKASLGDSLPPDRGRERLSPSPPSEPCVRFSRTRLSSQWFPHRDWLADIRASVMVNSPNAAKYAFGQRL